MSAVGRCPSCDSTIPRHGKSCPSCGESDFVRVVKRRVSDAPCFDCNFVHSGRPGRKDCHRCHGYGYVVVYMAKRRDLRTGEYDTELRYETAPDTWEAEQAMRAK